MKQTISSHTTSRKTESFFDYAVALRNAMSLT